MFDRAELGVARCSSAARWRGRASSSSTIRTRIASVSRRALRAPAGPGLDLVVEVARGDLAHVAAEGDERVEVDVASPRGIAMPTARSRTPLASRDAARTRVLWSSVVDRLRPATNERPVEVGGSGAHLVEQLLAAIDRGGLDRAGACAAGCRDRLQRVLLRQSFAAVVSAAIFGSFPAVVAEQRDEPGLFALLHLTASGVRLQEAPSGRQREPANACLLVGQRTRSRAAAHLRRVGAADTARARASVTRTNDTMATVPMRIEQHDHAAKNADAATAQRPAAAPAHERQRPSGEKHEHREVVAQGATVGRLASDPQPSRRARPSRPR